MTKDRTLSVYDAKSQAYLDMVSDWNDPCLDAFIAAIPAGAHVLDLGCGPGHAAAMMAQAGLRVTATDGSAEMVRLAARNPGVEARQEVFDDIAGVDIYDGIWASFSLLHAPKAKLPLHLAALHRAARSGARLHLVLKLGQGEKVDEFGRFYAYYERSELEDLLAKAGFSVHSHVTGADAGFSGRVEEWIAITAHA